MLKSFWQNDTVLKTISFFLAFVLWVYVGQSNNPDLERTIKNIPISFAHTDVLENNGLCLAEDTLQTVNIKATGKRKTLASINQNNIIASVDLSGISSSGTYTLPISLIFPVDGISVTNRQPDNFILTVESFETKTVPVNVEYIGTPGGDYILGDCVQNTNEIIVSGPKSIIDTITKASVSVDIDGITQQKTFKEKIKLFDSNNIEITSSKVSLNIAELSVACSVDKTKTVKIIPDVRYSPADDKVLYYDSITPSEVKISGDEDKLKKVEYLTTEPLYPAFNDNEYEANVPIKLPDGISLVDDITQLRIHISLVDAVEKKISLSDIDVIDDDVDLNYEISPQKTEVTLKCSQAEFSSIKQNQLGAYVSVKNLSEGTHRLKIEFNTKYHIIGDYYVDVTIIK